MAKTIAPSIIPATEADKQKKELGSLSVGSAYSIARLQFENAVDTYNETKSSAGSTREQISAAKISAVKAKYDLLTAAINAGIRLDASDPAMKFNP